MFVIIWVAVVECIQLPYLRIVSKESRVCIASVDLWVDSIDRDPRFQPLDGGRAAGRQAPVVDVGHELELARLHRERQHDERERETTRRDEEPTNGNYELNYLDFLQPGDPAT